MEGKGQGKKDEPPNSSEATNNNNNAKSTAAPHNDDDNNINKNKNNKQKKKQGIYDELAEIKRKAKEEGPELFPNTVTSSKPTYAASTNKKNYNDDDDDVIPTFQRHPSKHDGPSKYDGCDKGLLPQTSRSGVLPVKSTTDPPIPELFPATAASAPTFDATFPTSRDDKIQEKLEKKDSGEYPLTKIKIQNDSSDGVTHPGPELFPFTITDTTTSSYTNVGKDCTNDKIRKKLEKMDTDKYPLSKNNCATCSGGCGYGGGGGGVKDGKSSKFDEDNPKEDDVKNLRERHAANRRDFINNMNMNIIDNNNNDIHDEREEMREDNNHVVTVDDSQELNSYINNQQQLFLGAVAVDGMNSGNRELSRPYGSITGNFSITDEEEKEEEEVRVLEEEQEPIHASIVDEQEIQTVYDAIQVDSKKWRLCICLVVFIFIVIIAAIAVPLALRQDSNEGSMSVTIAPTISSIPSNFPSVIPTSIPTVIPSSSPSLSLVPTRTPVYISLVLQLDDKPEETGWSLVCNDAGVAGVDVNTRYRGRKDGKPKENIQVYEADNCTFTITDKGNDGLNNNGYYEIYYGTDLKNSGSRIVYGDGNFTNKSSSNFIVELPYVPWQRVGNDINGLNAYSVSMSSLGNIVVVGSPTYKQGRPGSAQVYMILSSSNELILIESINSDNNTNEVNRFGEAVSTSNDGTVIAIGAPYANGGTGSVYVYKLNTITNTIELIQELKGDNIFDVFGDSVDVSGDGSTIIVGADGGPGYVKVYHIHDDSNDSTWVQLGDTINGISNDGYSVSISNDGNIIAVGTPYPNIDTGYVKIYIYNNLTNTWVDYGNNNDDILVGDRKFDWFGDAVSLSADGNIIAIGAPNDDCNNDKIYKSLCGTVKVLQLNSNTSNWEQLGSNINGENSHDFSGFRQGVKLSDDGRIVAIGSSSVTYTSDDDGLESGSVRVFEYDLNDNKWIQISQDIDTARGFSVSLSGDGSIVAIGAEYDVRYAGSDVRVYRQGGGE